MSAFDLKKQILSLIDDVQFYYNGNHCLIDPHNDKNIYLGYKDIDKTYTSVDDLMNDPVFDGCCLKDIVNQIEMI